MPPFRLEAERHGAVTSTNDLVRAAAEAGAAAGLCIVAERQTAGRGRHGRTWQSPSGNLYASLLLRPERPLAEMASLSLVVAVTLAEAIEALGCPIRPEVKWPNDVLLGGAEVAGILLEAASADRGRCDWLIVGIGVNVRTSPAGGVGYPATDLLAAGLPDVQPASLLTELLPRLERDVGSWLRQGFPPFRDAWLARARGLEQPIELRLGDRLANGVLAGIDAHGAVLVRTASGKLERFAAGELVVVTDRMG